MDEAALHSKSVEAAEAGDIELALEYAVAACGIAERRATAMGALEADNPNRTREATKIARKQLRVSTLSLRVGKDTEAAIAAHRAATLSPRMDHAYFKLAQALRRLERVPEAIVSIDRALLLAPDKQRYQAFRQRLAVQT